MGMKTRIEDLVIDLSARKPRLQIGKRLIEAGLKCLDDVGFLQSNMRIAPDFDRDGEFTGTYVATLFRPHIEESALDLPVFALNTGQEAASQPDSALPCAGSALSLLKGLYAAESNEHLVLGVQVHLDDQPVLATLVELGFVTRDDVHDTVLVTTKGREAIGIRPKGLPSLPVEVAELTGNIAESELAARYIDGKIAGCERHIREGTLPENAENLRYVAAVLGEIAHEYRAGLHLPAVVIAGRVIPYNEDRTSGLVHADNLQTFYDDVYARNVKAGWWTDLETGQPKKRNVGELFILFVTEIVEAYQAWQEHAADDKLPDYPGLGVELGDLQIRLADFAGALAAGAIIDSTDMVNNPGDQIFQEIANLALDYEAIRKTPKAIGEPEIADYLPPMLVGPMIDAKLAFNAKREDHKIENRLKDDGKKT